MRLLTQHTYTLAHREHAMMDAPIACTLTARDLKARLTLIGKLNRDALRGHERSDLTLVLRYDRAAADRVHEMVRREQECCAFLDFEISEQADVLSVRIVAPDRARPASEALYEQFLTGLTAASSCGCS